MNPEQTTNLNSSHKHDVVVLASCNVDLISYVERMPMIGETLMGKKFQMGFGGKGANKAIACSRLGSDCAVIAKLGNDVFGKDYLNNFKANNINTNNVFISNEAATGVAPIYVDENGRNSIVVILGANLLLNCDDINASEDLIKNSNILLTNLEVPFESVLCALKLAKAHEAIQIPSNEIFNYVDYLVLNEVEVAQLSQVEVISIDDAKSASLALLNKLDVQLGVIVTLGENGVLYTDKPTKTSFHKKSSKVQVLDSTGAGDAFVGAFAHFLSRLGKDSINKAIQLACDYATLTVQALGTQASYPSIDKIDSKFKV